MLHLYKRPHLDFRSSSTAGSRSRAGRRVGVPVKRGRDVTDHGSVRGHSTQGGAKCPTTWTNARGQNVISVIESLVTGRGRPLVIFPTHMRYIRTTLLERFLSSSPLASLALDVSDQGFYNFTVRSRIEGSMIWGRSCCTCQHDAGKCHSHQRHQWSNLGKCWVVVVMRCWIDQEPFLPSNSPDPAGPAAGDMVRV